MRVKRKTYGADFKAKLVLEVLESEKTLNEIASKYEVLPKSLQDWKKQFLDNASLAFDKSAVVKEYKDQLEDMQKQSDALAKKLGNVIIERDWLEGKLASLDLSSKKDMLDKNINEGAQAKTDMIKPSLNRQLKLLTISKTAFYYQPVVPFNTKEDINLLNIIDKIYTKHPYYGHRRIHALLIRLGLNIGKKRVKTAMKFMHIAALYPKPKTTIANSEHEKYAYLLSAFKNDKNQVIIDTPNKVWSTDITYIRLEHGFAYLAAIIDWSTKKILSWKLSNTMDVSLTTSVLREALLLYPKPDILNTDQGSQYTAKAHIDILIKNNISISMDAKGRSIDNIVIERFWRTLKYEDIYLKNYNTIKEARAGINEYMEIYNSQRLHSALGYATPDEMYFKGASNKVFDAKEMFLEAS